MGVAREAALREHPDQRLQRADRLGGVARRGARQRRAVLRQIGVPSDRATADLVERLRDETIPKATAGKDMTADVGGTTAGYVDLAAEISAASSSPSPWWSG